MRVLYGRLSPHMRLSPATSPPYLRLRVWSHSRDRLGHHSLSMNLVPNRGAPSFYLPSFFTRRESQVALDFDPPHACRATQVPFRRMLIFFFPFGLVDRFLHLYFFMALVVSTDYPILDVNWQPLSFGLLPSGGISSPTTPEVFQFEAATSLPDHRGCRYLDDFLYTVLIVKGPTWGPSHRLLRACSLAINGNSGYLGASFWRECGWSFGFGLPSIHR